MERRGFFFNGEERFIFQWRGEVHFWLSSAPHWRVTCLDGEGVKKNHEKEGCPPVWETLMTLRAVGRWLKVLATICC